ncbi:hypothetical protein HK096_004199 [Nowakowskiella sp. JEL0078]|nr:hypothetical protein HK096_004199 [Nowakowskiella sp. JEL0078]
MADGNIFFSGGDRESFTDPVTGSILLTDGTNINRIYTPFDKTTSPWTVGSALAVGRWYPGVLTLNDGTQLIVGGVSVALSLSDYSSGIRNLNPTYEFYPSRGTSVTLQVLKTMDPWNLYPVLNQMPISGKVWIFVGKPSLLLDVKTGAVTNLPDMADNLHHPRVIYPFTPTAVMFPLRPSNNYTATMMICGGTLRDVGVTTTVISSTGSGSNYCSKILPEATNPTWSENFIQWPGTGKVMPNAVLMPDGKILYVNGAVWGTAGGDAGYSLGAHEPSYQTFIFDPITSTFVQGPDFTVGRLYHSGALLLPDGRIITTGNEVANFMDYAKAQAGLCFPFADPAGKSSLDNDPTASCHQPFEYRIEVFTPSYLSLSNPPIISAGYGTNYPKSITYGTTFAVKFDTVATSVSSISFIRYSTTTHSINPDQRFVELVIVTSNATHLTIAAPPNSFIAPPGNWMLFAVGKNGAIGHSITILMTGTSGTTTSETLTTTILPTSTVPAKLADWAFCSLNSDCANACCSSEYSNDGKFKCTPGGTPSKCTGAPLTTITKTLTTTTKSLTTTTKSLTTTTKSLTTTTKTSTTTTKTLATITTTTATTVSAITITISATTTPTTTTKLTIISTTAITVVSSPTTATKLGDWAFCTLNMECTNNCCSKEYSGDGNFKCTPGGSAALCTGNTAITMTTTRKSTTTTATTKTTITSIPTNLTDWVFCTISSQCVNKCCSKQYSNDGILKCTPGGTVCS